MILSLVMLLIANGLADEGGKQGKKASHMKVSGVVSKVQPDLVTVKGPWVS